MPLTLDDVRRAAGPRGDDVEPPDGDPGALVSPDVTVEPGVCVWAAVAAGAIIDMTGPGECLRIVAPQAAWVRVSYPDGAGRQAARNNIRPSAAVQVQQEFLTFSLIN